MEPHGPHAQVSNAHSPASPPNAPSRPPRGPANGLPRLSSRPARRVLALREEHRALIAARLGRGAGTGHRLLEHLYEKPIVSIEDVRSITGVTWAAANDLVRRLVEHGLVVEMTGHRRHRRFRYDPYVRLFDATRP